MIEMPEYDSAREAFDREAQRAMRLLLTTIINLPALPGTVRKLLNQYSSEMLSHEPQAAAG